MEKDIQNIKQYWYSFINHKKINDNLMKDIKESWIRCKNIDVDPLTDSIMKISKEELYVKLKQNKELIAVAEPIMERLYNIVEGSGFVIVLTDKEGCIIKIIGDSEWPKSKELNLVLGALWSEESIGSNAIGTSLYLDSPLQMIGAEHYNVNNHCLTCSAAPIHNDAGEIIGCINMSGSHSKASSHTTGIVVSGAYSIEKQFALINSNKLLNVIFDSMSDGMLILDKNFKIARANNAAAKILQIPIAEILALNINSILKNMDIIENKLNTEKSYYNMDCNFYIKNRRLKCSMNAFPLVISGELNGTVITFKDEGSVHKIVNTMAGFTASYRFEDIITKDESMKRTIELGKKAALTSCNILIEGSSGTGKELFAQSIHNYSNRSGGPFVAVNCASLPKELIESELFGYEKGAFTGATKDGHPGKFELANGGTIFLDEIGEMPLDMQSKLLRVLDNNKITRLGGTYEKTLNVRVIAATNRNLVEEIHKKNFREDLYYRLNVMNIKTIPLKDRPIDIETLANHFVQRLNLKSPDTFKYLTDKYLDIIKRYEWPGNVRELRNVVDRSYYLCESNNITEDLLYDYIVKDKTSFNPQEKTNTNKILTIEQLEKENITAALEKCNGDILKAANILNISRATIYRRIKKYGIEIKF
ncbi:sigma-54-dependent Fis family transcriptional regulator [Clostridium thailandense]|uniref:sigma-54-dependent Fis family transcriptional regulator n=1 Tax=Clostridium thailandense TaxID=2794346 RepID=UPI003989955E